MFVPTGRRAALYGHIRKHLGVIFQALARQKECDISEGHAPAGSRAHDDSDSAEILGLIGDRLSEREIGHCDCPAASVAVNAISMAKTSSARGYAVSTVGFNEEQSAPISATKMAEMVKALSELQQAHAGEACNMAFYVAAEWSGSPTC